MAHEQNVVAAEDDPLFGEISLDDETNAYKAESDEDSPPPYESIILDDSAVRDGGRDGGLFAGNEDLLVGEKPSVFEDFAVKVIDPVKQGEGVAAYISYKVVSTVQLEAYRSGQHEVIRRFRDFTWLKDTLRKDFSGIIIPPMPPRNVVEKYKMTPEFIEERRKGLESFLRKVLSHTVLCTAPQLKLFLQADESEFSIETSRHSTTLGGLTPAEMTGASNIARKTVSSATKFFKSISENVGLSPPKQSNGGGSIIDSIDESPDYRAIKAYYDHLEAHLNEVHQQAERLTRQHARLGKALEEFGHSMEKLSSKIEQRDSKEAYCSMLGERSVVASHGWEQSAKQLHLRFEAPLKEFLRAVQSAKRTIEDRDELLQIKKQAQRDLEQRRARVAKLQSTPGMRQDQVMEAERQLKAALEASQMANTKYEETVERMDQDIVRFQRERAQDLKNILLHFAQIQADSRKITAKAWDFSNIEKRHQQRQ
eukprot:jgi/Picsp_1/4635/NSC_02005-R1_sorting nexin 1